MDFSAYHVGIFDSGIGGHHVALQLQQQFPGLKVTALDDRANIPYGKKTPAELLACATPFIKKFEALEVNMIVIACNTCFINLEAELRALTKIPIVGYQPALEEALAETNSSTVVVCATGATLRSTRWQALKAAQPAPVQIIDVDCTEWVPLIEAGQISSADIKPVVEQVLTSGADSLVLGCTHYHWIAADILALLPPGRRLNLYEPSARVFAAVGDLLAQLVETKANQ